MTATTMMDGRSTSAGATTQARLGAIAKELHDALHALGAAPELQRVVREIPDARSRLAYVGDMTEKAAHHVLDLVDQAMPTLTQHSLRAAQLAAQIGQDGSLTTSVPAQFAEVLSQSAGFARDSMEMVARQKHILGEIMMAQDFQDLSGQVIKKVLDMITRIEHQLTRLLIDDGEEVDGPQGGDCALQGPQTPDRALAQTDVDDLLASMDF